jgi:hypothetical protein
VASLRKLADQPLQLRASTMCDWEEFLFTCNHSAVRLKSYCHLARNNNNNNHACPSVKILRKSWQQPTPCEGCLGAWTAEQTGLGYYQQDDRMHIEQQYRPQ